MGDRAIGFAYALSPPMPARLHVAPATAGVVSWNSFSPSGALAIRLIADGAPCTPWLDYARWDTNGRTSFAARALNVRIETDRILADVPFDGIDVRADGVDCTLVALATPVTMRPSMPYARDAMILDVPARSQYVDAAERGWCSAASTSMVCAFFGIDIPVADVARGVFDAAYGGTGNWAFNTAFAGNAGLRSVVAYLENLDHAQRFIEIGVPLVLSYAWEPGELPGAPIDRSDGHLAVLTGFNRAGDCAMNDPAHPNVRVVYARSALEGLWQRAGGVAYVSAPAGVPIFDVLR